MEGEPSPLRNPHQYLSMLIAAEAGIAPRIHYLDETARVAVIDFIEQQPLMTYPGGPPALAQALGRLLARVQATSVFPAFVNYPDIVTRLFAHVRRTGLFAAGLLDAHVERLERLGKAYDAGAAKLVSSHNDPVPNNILFDGKRLWLIDWESAYRNDPLVDVAIMLDGLARSPELEGALLQAWLGRAPDEVLFARLGLVRALTRLYYAGVLLSASAASSWVTGDTDLSAPTAAEFQQALRASRLKPRHAGNEAHPGQDVPRVISNRRRHAGIRRRRLARLRRTIDAGWQMAARLIGSGNWEEATETACICRAMLALISCLVVAFAAVSVRAAEFPARPIKLVIPYAAGGPTDIFGRLVAEYLGKDLKQAVFVENKAGAQGSIGAEMVAHAEPDGYTLFGTSGSVIILNPLLYKKLSYDPASDFRVLALVTEVPVVLCINSSVPATTIAEFVAYARQNPGKLNFGSSGTGSFTHLAAEMFKQMAGIEMTHVAYKGAAPALTDVISGNIQLMFESVSLALPQIRSGSLRPLGISSTKRISDFRTCRLSPRAVIPNISSASGTG